MEEEGQMSPEHDLKRRILEQQGSYFPVSPSKRRILEEDGPNTMQLWQQLLGLQGCDEALRTILSAVPVKTLQPLRSSCKDGRTLANLTILTLRARKPTADNPVPCLHQAFPFATALDVSEPLTNDDIAHIFARNLPLLQRLRRVAFSAPSADGDLSLANLNTLCGGACALTSLQWLGAPLQQQQNALRAVAHVTTLAELDLSGFEQLAGENLPLLSSLTGLTRLALSGCRHLRDPHLAALAPLHHLRSLDLSFTLVDGTGLAALGPAAAVTSLDLSACERVAGPGLQAVATSLPWLRQLDLSWAKLQQSELAALAVLSGLRQLALRNSALQPRTVEALAALTGLSALDLSDSPARGSGGRRGSPGLTPLSGLVGLVELDAEGGAADLAAFAALPRLRRLGLGLTGKLTANAPAFPQLRQLSVSSAALNDAALVRLGPMLQGLTSLTLRYGEGVTAHHHHSQPKPQGAVPALHGGSDRRRCHGTSGATLPGRARHGVQLQGHAQLPAGYGAPARHPPHRRHRLPRHPRPRGRGGADARPSVRHHRLAGCSVKMQPCELI